MNYTVHEILQARVLEWVAFPFSRGSSQPGDWTQVSCIVGGFFTSWATREAQVLHNLHGIRTKSILYKQWPYVRRAAAQWSECSLEKLEERRGWENEHIVSPRRQALEALLGWSSPSGNLVLGICWRFCARDPQREWRLRNGLKWIQRIKVTTRW